MTQPSNEQEQLELIPPEPLEPRSSDVPLDQLPGDDLLLSPPPDKALIESIRLNGLLQPVLLSQNSAGRLEVIEGRRRIKAVRMLGWDVLPAMIIETGSAVADALSIGLHATRRENAVAELGAVERLLREGADEKQIARVTGLSPQRIKQILKLKRLHNILRNGFDTGAITFGQALRLAALPALVQEQLAATFLDQGKLTTHNVDAARKVQHDSAAKAIPFGQLKGLGDKKEWAEVKPLVPAPEPEPTPAKVPTPIRRGPAPMPDLLRNDPADDLVNALVVKARELWDVTGVRIEREDRDQLVELRTPQGTWKVTLSVWEPWTDVDLDLLEDER